MQLGPATTVALAFFLGELGDKTQLTAITLAADVRNPLLVLAGTVAGMIATGALGIIVGKKLGDRIPELGLKLLAATIFMFFGLQKLAQTIPAQYLRGYTVLPFLGLLTLVVLWLVHSLLRQRRAGIQSEFITTARLLRDYYLHMKKDLDRICLGLENCCVCQGKQCAIGESKEIVQAALAGQAWPGGTQASAANHGKKPFSEEKVLDCLVDTLWLLSTVKDEERLTNAHLIRNEMEAILLGQPVNQFEDIASYLKQVRALDTGLAAKIDVMFHKRKPALVVQAI